MMDHNTRVLVSYRLEQSDEALKAARTLLENDLPRSAVNRAYYAMYYSVLALLATRKQETSKHSGAISLFDREFVRPGTFTKDFSRWLHDGFELRQRSDYAPEPTVTQDEAGEALRHAVSFVSQVKATVAKLIQESNNVSNS